MHLSKQSAENWTALYTSNIEFILRQLEDSELAVFDNKYISDLKDKIKKLKELFSLFRKTTDSGKGYLSLRGQKLKTISKWLEEYNSSSANEVANKLLSDFQRISKIFNETLHQTYENIEERVIDVLEYGNLFVKNVNTFLLDEKDLDIEDILTANDGLGEPDINLKDVPKKVLTSMLKAREAYKKFLERINSQIQEIYDLLDELEGIDFLELMEQFNKRNKLVKDLIKSFVGLSETIKKNLEQRSNAKIEYAEMFEPGFFKYYRELLNRAAKFLPEDMANSLLRQIEMTRIDKIMKGSLEPGRKQKSLGEPKDLFESLSFDQNDKLLLKIAMNNA